MKVTTLGKDSFLNQVAELVKKAQTQKSNLENMADRVAGYLFYAALIVGIFSLVFGQLVLTLVLLYFLRFLFL